MREDLRDSGTDRMMDKKRIEEIPSQSERHFRLKTENNTSPARKVKKLGLAEIIDVQAVQPLMDDFYKLTHIPMGLNDLKGNVLAGVGWQEICSRFHRVNPETCKHCIESDIKLSKGVDPGGYKLYKCKNGMWDIVTPIMVSGQHVGYVFAGQFFFEDEPLDYEFFRSQARKHGFNEDEYIKALEKVPRLSREAVDTAMSFLMTFANMVSKLGYSNLSLVKSLTERDTLVEELRKSDERFRSVLENSLDSAYRMDLRKRFFDYMSPVIEKITGFSAREINEMSINDYLDRIHPDDRHLVIAGSTRSLEEGFGAHEYRFKRRDGKYCWLADHFSIIKDRNGIACFRAGIVRDITERKKVEEALKLSNLYNRSLIEASLDPLVTIGRDGKITDVNGATEQITGYSRNDLIGTDFSDYFTESEKARTGYQQVFMHGEIRDYPLEIRHREGNIIPVLYNASVYRDENGEIIGAFAAARDITDLNKAKEALQRAHDNLEKLVEERTVQLESACLSLKEKEKSLSEAQKLAHIGSWDWDLITGEVQWSDELYDIFRRDPQKPGASYDELLNYVHPDDRDYVDNIIRRNLTNERRGIDYRIVLENGEERTVHAERELIFDKDNVPVRAKGIVQDITERKKAEEVLEKMQETHIKEIHHRIKNNLQVISSLLSLEADKFSDEKMLESFRESQNRVASMALIHEELYKGNELDTLDFAAYLQKLTSDLFELYNLGNNNVNLKLDLEKIHLDMDIAIPLGIIVNELVSNSLKHAFPAGKTGEVRISFCKKENFAANDYLPGLDSCCKGKDSFHYILAVEDNGKGIPEEIDVQETDSLGLKLVNILVEQVGGCIDLKRDSGTKFTIWFRK